MKKLLTLGLLIVFILTLAACAPQYGSDETAFAEVTAFAPGSENSPASVPDAQSAIAASAPAVQESSDLLIVYEKAGSLWVWRSGSSVQLTSSTQDSHPQLSSDGALVAFQRGSELWMVDNSGKNLSKVFAEQGAQPLQFEFAPGSHLLYFTTKSNDAAPRYDLWQADASTNVLHNLLAQGQAGKFSFAPNGSLLALVQAGRMMTVRPDGSALKQVFEFQPIQTATGEYYPPIAWLSNAYGFKTVIPGTTGQMARLMFVMADGAPAAQLAEFPAASPALSDIFIAPDGSKVVYLRDQGDTLELHVIDASTADNAYFSHPRGKFGLLGWTPDSQGLLYWLDDPRSAWLYSADAQVTLSDVAFAEELSWVGQNEYLFISDGELRLRRMGQTGQMIDNGVGSYTAVALR